jgi:DNA repair protein RadC
MAVILDGQGRPIQILRHTLGGTSSTNFFPHLIAGVAASTRGARTVYMVHNHPSTTARFSPADANAARMLSKSIESVGLRFGGSLVVSDGDAHQGTMVPKYIFHPGGELVNHSPAAMNHPDPAYVDSRAVQNVIPFDDRPGTSETHPMAMAKIQVVERMFEVRKGALFPRITQPKDAIEQIPPLLRNLPGVALLDQAGRLVGVIQMSMDEMRFAASNGDTIINQEQGQGRDYIGSEEERANPEQDKRVYKRTSFARDTQAGAWNNPLAMLMAAIERSNAERLVISIGPNDIGASNNDTRSVAVRNLQRAVLRVSNSKVTIDDVISNDKNFINQVISPAMYGSFDSGDTRGIRFKTGERGGFNEPGANYGSEGEQAPIEREAPKSLGDVVSQGMGVEEGGKPKAKTMSLVFYDSAIKGENSERNGNPEKDRQATAIIGPDGVTIKGYSQFADADISLEQWQELMDDLKRTGEARIGREHGIYDADLVITSAKNVKEEGSQYGVQEGGEAAPEGQDSGLENAQPAAPIIKKTRKPRAPKAPGVNVSAFPRLDATPGVFGRLSGEQMKQFGLSDAMLDQFVEHSTTGQVASGVQTVKTMDDAAHIMAGMRKRPQEQLVLLITDKAGKPLQIAAHQLNGPTACGFNPGILVGTAASTPGAANVWVVHNHPSQKGSLSPADISSGSNLQRLLEAANLRYMGMMAIAGDRYAMQDNNGKIYSDQKIRPLPRKFTIPLTERMFSYAVSKSKVQLTDQFVAGPEIRRIFGDDQPGIVLLDNANRPVAAIPLDGDVMTAMKAILPGDNPTKQTGFSKYVAGIDRSNAVNMMLYTAGMDKAWATKAIENMSYVANSTKITLLDVFDNKGVSRSNEVRSYGNDFQEPGSGYNRGENAQENAAEGGVENAAETAAEAPSSLQDVVEQGLAGPKKKTMRR